MHISRIIFSPNVAKRIPGFLVTGALVLLAGCGSGGLSGSSFSFALGACGRDGLAVQDITGQCRATPTTMGALEADG